MRKTYVLATLCYGPNYANLFLNNLLKSVLDPTNLPDVVKDYDVEYVIYTDEETLPTIAQHANFSRLNHVLGKRPDGSPRVDVHTLAWPTEMGPDKYAHRYGAQIQTMSEACKIALDKKAYLSYWSCDMVVAQGFFRKILAPMEKGHGAVLGLPLRACAESLRKYLDPHDGAFEAAKLFELSYANMHPIFCASHWEAAQFNKLPFTLLWNTGKGLIGHSFSSTPHILVPNERMIKSDRVMDAEIPELCENPYWATDWTDAPIVGVEPLACYYPPFGNFRASEAQVTEFAKGLPKGQWKYLNTQYYYPNYDAFKVDEHTEATGVTAEILRGLK